MATATASVPDIKLRWCRWFHCVSSFDLSLTPDLPGLFAVAREEDGPQKRMTVVKIEAADSLFHGLNQLFTAGCPLRDVLAQGRCFLRYAVVPDAAQRRAALAAFQLWLAGAAATPSPLINEFLAARGSDHPFRDKED